MGQIKKYQAKISGPILDRIDFHVEVSPLPYETLNNESEEEGSQIIRKRIIQCREIQSKRFSNSSNKLNAFMRPKEIKEYAGLCDEGKKILETAVKELRLSARAYFKILKISRTIADLEGFETIRSNHVAEAIQYRSLDRSLSF